MVLARNTTIQIFNIVFGYQIGADKQKNTCQITTLKNKDIYSCSDARLNNKWKAPRGKYFPTNLKLFRYKVLKAKTVPMVVTHKQICNIEKAKHFLFFTYIKQNTLIVDWMLKIQLSFPYVAIAELWYIMK